MIARSHLTRRRALRGLVGTASLFSVGCDPYGLGELPRKIFPLEQVELPAPPEGSPFLMMRYQVTQALYEELMGVNPSTFTGPLRPVEGISWEDAIAFCNVLSAREGLQPAYQGTDNNCELIAGAKGFRLPFEAEWEWAARRGVQYIYADSDDLDEVGWYDENSGGETHPVGEKRPNGFGLYDMSGNVWEWCADDYSLPGAHRSGASGRVIRGGSWGSGADSCRVSYRGYYSPVQRGDYLGTRLVRSV